MQESLYKKDFFFFKRQKKSLRSLSCDIFPAVQSLISHMPTLLWHPHKSSVHWVKNLPCLCFSRSVEQHILDHSKPAAAAKQITFVSVSVVQDSISGFSDAWDDFEDARTIWSFFPFSLAYICGTIFPIRLQQVLNCSLVRMKRIYLKPWWMILRVIVPGFTTSVGVYASLTWILNACEWFFRPVGKYLPKGITLQFSNRYRLNQILLTRCSGIKMKDQLRRLIWSCV